MNIKMNWKSTKYYPEKNIKVMFMDKNGKFFIGTFEDLWFFPNSVTKNIGQIGGIDISEIKYWIYLKDLRESLKLVD